MRFKEGVYIRGATVQLLVGLIVMDAVYRAFGYKMTVTSIADGNHSAKSKHWRGDAADLRTRDVGADDLIEIERAGRDSLPRDFDLILESDHFHLEFDPKAKMP